MRVNLHNIVSTAIERGLIDGYSQITSEKFAGTPDEAIDCLYNAVWNNLGDLVDFKEEPEPGNTPEPKQIGFTSEAKGIPLQAEEAKSIDAESGMRRNRHRSTKVQNKR